MKWAAFVVSFALVIPTVGVGYDVDVIQQTGDSGNRIDLLILGDGYRDSEQDKLAADVDTFLDEMWVETPFGEYKNYFNIKLVHVISAESGADQGSYGDVRDTALGASFNCFGVERLLCVDEAEATGVMTDHAPESDFTMVIVNDPKYGGSGGTIPVLSTNALSGEIAEHEFAHILGGLIDEYEDPYPGYPPCDVDCPEPNATLFSIFEKIKWNLWIEEGETPLPTPQTLSNADVVGAFEGARFESTGVFRPMLDCKMRALGTFFCDVCSEALVLSVYDLVEPIDAAEPHQTTIALSGEESALLEIDFPVPVPDTMSFEWRVDDIPTPETSASFVAGAVELGDGVHAVSVRVVDSTELVRNDPDQLLLATRSWNIDVEGAAEDDTGPDSGEPDSGEKGGSGKGGCDCKFVAGGADRFSVVELLRLF